MLRQIRYFQAVVKYHSFSEAAYACNISQSAISQQIQALEKELGFPLLERQKRKFRLTPAGEFFYKKSLVLLADYEQIVREAGRLSGGEQECLKVGFLRCYSGQEFHMALEEFSGRHPDIPVKVFYGNHDELYHMLMRDEIDLAFNDQRRAFSDEFMNMLLASSITHIEIAGRNPLSSLDKVTVRELKNIPCILVSSEAERETEAEYYSTIIGLQGEKLFAGHMEEARMLVISGKGFLPGEGTPAEGSLGTNIVRIPLYRGAGRSGGIIVHFGKKKIRKKCQKNLQGFYKVSSSCKCREKVNRPEPFQVFRRKRFCFLSPIRILNCIRKTYNIAPEIELMNKE